MSEPRFTATDAQAFVRAVLLAKRGAGHVEPNPCVGAVIHVDGRIVAEGFHAEYGEAHAEEAALAAFTATNAGEVDRRAATLVVTLEPCSSSGGAKKREPCVEAIVASGIGRVVIGADDPDPRHQGRAYERLRAAGVEVVVAPRGTVPEELLAPFRRHLRSGRPHLVLKWAQTSDGRWSLPGRRYLASDESLRAVHRLRAHCDAIAVGSGTLLADDPLLTVRPPELRTIARPLIRIVLDGRGRAPTDSQLFRTAALGPVWWITGRAGVPSVSANPPTPSGVERIELAQPHDLADSLLPELRRRGVARLLVEGGPTLAAALLAAGVVDRLLVFVAPDRPDADPRDQAAFDASLRRLLGSSAMPRLEAVELSGCDACFQLSFS